MNNKDRVAELERLLAEGAEQLAAANKELEMFAYSVSHDLRAPLRAMEGFARILGEDYAEHLPSEAKNYLEIIVSSAGTMNELIDDLLTYSRSSRAELHWVSLDMERLAHEAVEQVDKARPGHGVKIEVEKLLPACGDPYLIQKLLVQLIDNGVKFSEHARERRVVIGSLVQDRHHVFFVKDSGVGFEMEYAGKLFGLFQRLHRSDEFAGNGLGLALVQRIAHRHGGRVWTEAKVNEGACFYFSLPKECPDNAGA